MDKIEEKVAIQTSSSTPNQTKRSNSSFMGGGFFEVTINAEKLSGMITHINELLAEQNNKIESLKQDFRCFVDSIEKKVENESKKNGMLFSKLELKTQENANILRVYLEDSEKKSEQRDFHLSSQVESLKSQILKVEDESKKDLNNGLKVLKKEIFGENEDFEKEFNSENKNSNNNGSKSLLQKFTDQLKEVKSSFEPVFDGMFEQKVQEVKKSFQEEQMHYSSRRKDKFLPNFPQKDKFKEEITQKIVYPSHRKETTENENENNISPPLEVHSKFGNKIRHMSYTKLNTEEEFEENWGEVHEKIEALEKAFHNNLVVQTEIKNKETIIDEKLSILGRKLEKNAQEVAEIKNNIRRIDNQKMDDKAIDDLRNQMKWAIKDLEESISKKCSNEDLHKEKLRLSEKISIAHENITEKADKNEIQKALFFLESKIKEIILLIAAEQSDEREGAIMRVTAKCLSCDKEIEKQYQSKLNSKLEKNREALKKSEGQEIKTMTHRVRQRFKKEISKNMTLGNESLEEIDSII